MSTFGQSSDVLEIRSEPAFGGRPGAADLRACRIYSRRPTKIHWPRGLWPPNKDHDGSDGAVLRPCVGFCTLLLMSLPAALLAQTAESEPLFRDATFEELANITVTTVSKREEKSFTVAAAVHVITGEEIRRSGARMLPEALRLTPGVEVGAINSRSYAVAMRGFNGTTSNKLLPLIDGRSLYSQRFASTIWDIRDIPLEDVEQIEVIGGPGGTTWGANAVNGVINIITKSARDTLGDMWVVGAGTFEQGFLYARHGFSVGNAGSARFYVKAFQRDDSQPVNVADNNDAWSQVRTGFRFDREAPDGSQTTVTGDIFYSDADQLFAGLADVAHSSGGHLLAKHLLPLEGGSQLKLQSYIDIIRRDSGGNQSKADVFDVDLLVTPRESDRLAFSWGANCRLSQLEDAVNPAGGVVTEFLPAQRSFKQGSGFLEAIHRPESGRYQVTAGAKAEYNDFTHWEFMPSLRAAWTPTPNTTWWTAWSRAARIPSRFENDQMMTITTPTLNSRTLPSPDLDAEKLNAFELGWRWRGPRSFSADVSLYFHDYTKLATNEAVLSPPGTDSRYENLGHGTSRGAEVQLVWRPLDWWQWQAAYTYTDLDMEVAANSTDTALVQVPTLTPRHLLSLRSSWNIGTRWEIDAWFRSVAKLPQPGRLIPAYQTLDLRVGRQFGGGWDISVVGQNLLSSSHREFRFFTVQAAVARGFYVRIEKRH